MELSLPQVNKGARAIEWWRRWLAPRPFTVVSTAVYLFSLIYILGGQCAGCQPVWKSAISIAGLIALMSLDRLDFYLYGETPPLRAALLFLALRIVLTVIVVTTADWWYESSLGIFMLALIPYIAALYAGTKASLRTGLVVWVLFAAIEVVASIPGLTKVTVYQANQTSSYYLVGNALIGQYISTVSLFTMVLVFVLTTARVAALEKAHTTRSKRLLAQLEDSHSRLRAYSERAIADTEERNRSARDIHDRLGHYLTAVSVQISKAIAFRDINATAATEAVTAAKQAISQALQDVRHSVASLRTNLVTPDTLVTDDDQMLQEYSPEERETRVMRTKGWLRWLVPRPFDLIAGIFYVGVFLIDWVSGTGVLLDGHPLAVPILVLLLALVLMDRLDFAFFKDGPPVVVGLILLATRTGIILLIFFWLGVWYSLFLFVLIPYICFIYFGDKAGYLAGGLLWLAMSVPTLVATLQDAKYRQLDTVVSEYIWSLLVISFMLAVAVATARTVGKENSGRARAEKLFSELRETHTRLASLSQQAIDAVEDRNRMARDIHDGMGHYLTAMSVQLEKSLAFREIDPAVADKALDESKRLAGEALQEVRNTIGTLGERQTPPTLARSLAELVVRIEHDDLKIELTLEGSEERYSGQALSALYRAAQEGLTNIRKHSKAQNVQIRVTLGNDEARMELSDDGRGFELGEDEAKGYGLQSMRERLELAGGSLRVETAPGQGVHLAATVPAHAATFHRPASPTI